MRGDVVLMGCVLGAIGVIGYFAWFGVQARRHLRRTVQQRQALRQTYHEEALQRDHLLEQFEQVSTFCRRLTNASQKDVVYHVTLRQFAELAATDPTPPWVSLWLYETARYGFVFEGANAEATARFTTTSLSLKETLLSTMIQQGKPAILPQLPALFAGIAQPPIPQSAGVVLIPLIVEDRPYAMVLMVCAPTQLAALQRNLRAVNLIAMQASLSLGNLLHRELAMLDPLTRVHNVAYFQERFATELQRCQRFELSLSLLLVDIDGFKGINDTYGHQAGDLVLLGIAQILKGGIRAVDLLARYGGDEFIMMLPETGRGQDPTTCEALPLAQRLRLAIARQPFELPNQPLRTTVSIGIGLRDPRVPVRLDAAALFKQADEQLYRAKRAGKNRCAIPQGPIVGPE